jgi:hypothetical protein
LVSYLAHKARFADARLAGNDHQPATALPRRAKSSI